MPRISDYTNAELVDIAANPSHLDHAPAVEELDKRIHDSGYDSYKGFERPQNPPPNP